MAFKFTEKQKMKLYTSMAESNNELGDASTINAGYTYLGQFIAHEIVKSTTLFSTFITTPYMNLDSIYGIDLDLQLFDRDGKFLVEEKYNYIDFKRGSNGALLLEKRNDENVLIAQFHCFWLKLHNALFDYFIENKKFNVNLKRLDKINRIRDLMVFIFNKIIINDYLKVILDKEIYTYYKKNKPFLYPEEHFKSIPVEFSNAVFRFGHSMILDEYVLRTRTETEHFTKNLSELFVKDKSKNLPDDMMVDWHLFFGGDNTNTANKIDLHMSQQMNNLHEKLDVNLCPSHNIVAINLKASEDAHLLSGYKVHEKIKEIANKKKINLDTGLLLGNNDLDKKILNFKGLNEKNIPLWLYILQESKNIAVSPNAGDPASGMQLGKCASIIVAEVIINSIKKCKASQHEKDNIEVISDYFKTEYAEIKMINLIKKGKEHVKI